MVSKRALEKSYGQFRGELAKNNTQMVDLGIDIHTLTKKLEIVSEEVVDDYLDS